MRARVLLAAATVGGLAATACTYALTPRGTLDRSGAQREISVWLASSFHTAEPPVTCPPSIPASPGARFTCTAVLGGQPVTVQGTVTAGSGGFRVSLSSSVVDTGRISSELAGRLGSQGITPSSVDCGAGPVRVVDPGQSLSCVATAPGATLQVTATPVGPSGNLQVVVAPSSKPAPPGLVSPVPRPDPIPTPAPPAPAPAAPPVPAPAAPLPTTPAPPAPDPTTPAPNTPAPTSPAPTAPTTPAPVPTPAPPATAPAPAPAPDAGTQAPPAPTTGGASVPAGGSAAASGVGATTPATGAASTGPAAVSQQSGPAPSPAPTPAGGATTAAQPVAATAAG